MIPGNLFWIGIDYGVKQSVCVVMERHPDGSITVHDEVEGRGLDEVFGRTTDEQ